MLQFVSVKNFEKYQRYRDRLPRWIKLHYAVLDDPAFLLLDEVQQGRYMKLLLVASRCDNKILNDQMYLQSMLRLRGAVDLSPLIHAGFLVTFGAKKRHQHVTKWRTETETEIETEIRRRPRASIEDFCITPELEAWSANEQIPNPAHYVEAFKDYWRSTDGKLKNGRAVKDWPATFRNHLRHLTRSGQLVKPDWKSQFLQQDCV